MSFSVSGKSGGTQIIKGGDNSLINSLPLSWGYFGTCVVNPQFTGRKTTKKHELNLGCASILGIPAPEVIKGSLTSRATEQNKLRHII